MKNLLLATFLLLVAQMMFGQVETQFFPAGNAIEKMEKGDRSYQYY